MYSCSYLGKRRTLIAGDTPGNPMNDDALLARVIVEPKVCRGRPHIRGTRIYIAIILDALFEGLTPEQVIDHYPSLVLDDIRAAVAYATTLAEENGGLAMVNHHSLNNLFQSR
ncbi:MAG TPA: DUF433 domain-containing protein [Candidatus Binatia bacterium]|nr:DUF433 domain-containing protein [Candidatus Binatia bacterium]